MLIRFTAGTIFLRDGNGHRTLRISNGGQPIEYTVFTGYSSTPGMAWLTDPGRNAYIFDEVQLFANGHLASSQVGASAIS